MSLAACGTALSLCVGIDGTLWVFGALPLTDVEGDNCYPQKHPTLENISYVACGESQAAVIDMSGKLWTFGYNAFGECGLGHTFEQDTPGLVCDSVKMPLYVKQVACGSYHTICVTSEGYSWGFGFNNVGQLGLGSLEFIHNKPQRISTLQDINAVAASGNFSIFLSIEGAIYATGENLVGQLGLGEEGDMIPAPVKVQDLPPVDSISAGVNFSLALSDCDVYGTGQNEFGQIGLTTKLSKVFEKIPNLPPVKNIVAGKSHSYFIDTDNYIWGCGSNELKQLGLRQTEKITVPQKLAIGPVSVVSQSYNHTLVKDESGDIWGLGCNAQGQLGTGKKEPFSDPCKLDARFSNIIGNPFQSRAKSANK